MTWTLFAQIAMLMVLGTFCLALVLEIWEKVRKR